MGSKSIAFQYQRAPQTSRVEKQIELKYCSQLIQPYFVYCRSAAAYYALVHHSKSGLPIPAAEIDLVWNQLPEKQKKKVIEEHKKKQKEYVVEFENFIRVSFQ